jgi:3D-(3,5/4)-trihydroxycyclohexane-1,2-dione acylhydrolase (decyclizing)
MRAARRTSVAVITTDPALSTSIGGAWWDVAIPEVSNLPQVVAARAVYDGDRRDQPKVPTGVQRTLSKEAETDLMT